MNNDSNKSKGGREAFDTSEAPTPKKRSAECLESDSSNVDCDEPKPTYESLEREYQAWNYSAPIIRKSYWTSQGFAAAYAYEMGNFLYGERGIKIYSIRMMQGLRLIREGMNFIHLRCESDEVDFLRHDPALLPHWREFAGGLMQVHRWGQMAPRPLEKIIISHIELHSDALNLLLPPLKKINTQQLIFNWNHFDRDSIPIVARIVKENENIEILEWTGSSFENVDDLSLLCNGIRENPSIREVRFVDTLGDNHLALHPILDLARISLTKLSLSHNPIGTQGVAIVADFLASDPALNELSLECTNLNGDDAILLANALPRNKHLRELDLSGNNDTQLLGRRALLRALFNIDSLNAVSDSNHTCYLRGLELGSQCFHLGGTTPRLNRAAKISAMLYMTENGFFNFNHFNDISIKLMPHVLCLAQMLMRESVWMESVWMGHAYRQLAGEPASHDTLNPNYNFRWPETRAISLSYVFDLLHSWGAPTLFA